MGDRVAVIKDGVLQQVDAPETLYANPVNVFVAAFIGSPSMNLMEGTLERNGDQHRVVLGDQSLDVPRSLIDDRAGLADRVDRTLVVGIRPEDLEDAALRTDHPEGQRLRASIDVREALGAETLMHFALNTPTVDSGDPDALDELGDQSVSRCTGRFSPRSRARVGDNIEIAVDVENLHFFDPSTHLAID